MKIAGRALLITTAMLFLFALISGAAGEKALFYKSEKLRCQNEPYFEENGEIYLPIRPVAEALGIKVGWNQGENSVTLDSEKYALPKYDGAVPLTSSGGSVGLYLDGQKSGYIKGRALDGSAYFPLSALEKAFGIKARVSEDFSRVEFYEFKDYTAARTLTEEEYRSNFLSGHTSGSSHANHDHKYELAYKLYEENKNDLKFLTNFFFNEWRFDPGMFEFWMENDEVRAWADTNTGYGASLNEWFVNNAGENFNGNTDRSVTEFIRSEKDAYDALKRVLSGPVIASVKISLSFGPYSPYIEVNTSSNAFYSKIQEVTLLYSYPPRRTQFDRLNDGWTFIDGLGDEIPRSDVTDEVREMYNIPLTYDSPEPDKLRQ